MMKVSLILVLLLIAFSCGGKKKKKTSPGFDVNRFLRRPKTSAPKTFAPKTTVKPIFKPTVESKSTIILSKNISLWDINSTDQFYKAFGLKRLPQEGSQGGGDGIGSSAGGNSAYGPGCLPTPTMVNIVDWPAHLNHRYKAFPPCVKVNRCSGCCFQFEQHSCKSTSSFNKPMHYHKLDLGSNSQSAMSMQLVPAGSSFSRAVMLVVEDLDCGCGCSKSMASCNQAIHNWNEGRCNCECKPGYQSRDLQCSGYFSFDEDTCSCRCAHREGNANCPHDMEWSTQECKCVCKNHLGCPHNMEWSTQDCKCVCKTDLGPCKRFQYRHPATCNCVY